MSRSARRTVPVRCEQPHGTTGTPCNSAYAARDVFGNKHQRPNQPEILIAGNRDRRQRAQLAGEHGIAQQRFAKIVGSMAESDDIDARSCAISYTARLRKRLHKSQPWSGWSSSSCSEARPENKSRPRRAFEIFADGLDGPQKLALLHGECADRKFDGRALLQAAAALRAASRNPFRRTAPPRPGRHRESSESDESPRRLCATMFSPDPLISL